MKYFKGIGSAMLAFVFAVMLLVTAQPTVEAQAARQRSVTLYAGEKIYWTDYHDVKSCSASKKSIVSAKRDASDKSRLNITAKKPGKVTLTVKTTGETIRLVVTVVKQNCTVKPVMMTQTGYVLFKVTNNSKLFYDSVGIQYTLKNPEGEIIKRDTDDAEDLVPGKTSFVSVYVGSDVTIDVAKSSAKIVTKQTQRSVNATYKNRSSKLKVTQKRDGDSNQKITLKNTYSGDITGSVDLMFYDEAGKLVDVDTVYVYMTGNSVKTMDNYIPSALDYAACKMNIHVYSKHY